MKPPTTAHCRPHPWLSEIQGSLTALHLLVSCRLSHQLTDWEVSPRRGPAALGLRLVVSAARGHPPPWAPTTVGQDSPLPDFWQMQHSHLGMGETVFRSLCLMPRDINNNKELYLVPWRWAHNLRSQPLCTVSTFSESPRCSGMELPQLVLLPIHAQLSPAQWGDEGSLSEAPGRRGLVFTPSTHVLLNQKVLAHPGC